MPTLTSIESAARAMVSDQFCVRAGESVLVTADSATDLAAVDAVISAASAAGAKPLLCTIPKLPFQGLLADEFIPEPLVSAAECADVWFDMTFPYMAGSNAHDRAMKAGRVRYLLLGDIGAEGLQRLYGSIGLDRLFEAQRLFDELMASNSGAKCRVTSASGTDVAFNLGRPGGSKPRHADKPGTSTVMGSCIFYPETESVRGTIALDAIFHEFYALTPEPIVLEVEGEIRKVQHHRDHAAATERALKRAAGDSGYGRVIHFTCGFHPAARFDGRSFIEDIRSTGANAIGLGVPWWEPGGGENHPDGVVASQSLWIENQQVVRDGRVIAPAALASAIESLSPA
jgi:2,5-dihydroxypyridine 5,6-dioxygenase